jgi:hypothetical protein
MTVKDIHRNIFYTKHEPSFTMLYIGTCKSFRFILWQNYLVKAVDYGTLVYIQLILIYERYCR